MLSPCTRIPAPGRHRSRAVRSPCRLRSASYAASCTAPLSRRRRRPEASRLHSMRSDRWSACRARQPRPRHEAEVQGTEDAGSRLGRVVVALGTAGHHRRQQHERARYVEDFHGALPSAPARFAAPRLESPTKEGYRWVGPEAGRFRVRWSACTGFAPRPTIQKAALRRTFWNSLSASDETRSTSSDGMSSRTMYRVPVSLFADAESALLREAAPGFCGA